MKKFAPKKKNIIIKMQVSNINDVGFAMTMISNQLKNGLQYNEFKSGSCIVSFTMDFDEFSDYEEKEIDGVWYRIIKSRI
jgi:hypothetical protein